MSTTPASSRIKKPGSWISQITFPQYFIIFVVAIPIAFALWMEH